MLHESTWAAAKVCYLEDLFVDATVRGTGIGRLLLQDLVDLARSNGWPQLYWHTRGSNATARRLYDERGQLIAGDWRRSDGVQTIYHHAARPKLHRMPERLAMTRLSFDAMWQLEPSAKEAAQPAAQLITQKGERA